MTGDTPDDPTPDDASPDEPSPDEPSSDEQGTDDTNAVQVNFARPIPIFPLDQVTLLPQQVLPLHIFEPRYRQMVADALDASGLIAMAVFAGTDWKQQYHARPPIKPAVCVGHIVRHEKLGDGRYNLLLQGVCRARVVMEPREQPPTQDPPRLYRVAMLEPVGLPESEAPLPLDTDEARELERARATISAKLQGTLSALTAAEPVLEYLRNDDIPTRALLELIAMTLVDCPTARYRLLEEGDAGVRARIMLRELDRTESLIRRAQQQGPDRWPKGQSWN